MASVVVSEAARLRAEIAQASRRRDSARRAAEHVQQEVEALRQQLEARSAAGAVALARVGHVEVGSRGRIIGLAEAPQLNGQEVEILGKDVKKGRCKVRLASGEQRQVPSANLESSAPASVAAGTSAVGSVQGCSSHDEAARPVLSASSLRLRSCLSSTAGSLPCELWPFVYSSITRVFLTDKLLGRLVSQVDAAARDVRKLDCSKHLRGEIRNGCQVKLENVDGEFVRVLLEMCNILGWAILGTRAFRTELDRVWAVVQKEGDYCPLESHRNSRSPVGFSALLDIQLPSSLSSLNHERPTKGAYGFHDGIHNFVWKSDRTTDFHDLIQPGIIQCELATGYLYVFPQWLQGYTYPFDGPGERKWIAANVALFEVPLES